MWRNIRVLLLLLVLLWAATHTWFERVASTGWKHSLWVGIFPVNADGSATAQAYIDTLKTAEFTDIEDFMAREAHRYGKELAEPVHIVLYPQVRQVPPQLGRGEGLIGTAWWSLKLRWFAWREAAVSRAPPRVRLFVLYHDPATLQSVPDSHGMQKGLLGVVHAFALRPMAGSNSIVIAHELLHTLGATDKYDPSTGVPVVSHWVCGSESTAAVSAGRGGNHGRPPRGVGTGGADARGPERCCSGTRNCDGNQMDAPLTMQPPLATDNVAVSVGARELVSDLTVSFAAGDFVAVLGRNGCGKTLTLHTLAGLRQPARGTVFLDGIPADQHNRRAAARRLGLLAQDHGDGFVTTCLETVLIGRHPHLSFWQWETAQDGQLARSALAAVDLSDFGARRTDTLSGGEQRRVAIAALLAQAPGSICSMSRPTTWTRITSLPFSPCFRSWRGVAAQSLRHCTIQPWRPDSRIARCCCLGMAGGRWGPPPKPSPARASAACI